MGDFNARTGEEGEEIRGEAKMEEEMEGKRSRDKKVNTWEVVNEEIEGNRVVYTEWERRGR